LNQHYHSYIRRIDAGFELELETPAKGFLLLKLSNLYEFLGHGDVRQMPSAILASRYLRFRMIEGGDHENISILLLRPAINLDVTLD
jgi:hypothetical protein